MRKIINISLWLETKEEENDLLLRKDIENELKYCNHNFEVVKFETMEIANERAARYAGNSADNIL